MEDANKCLLLFKKSTPARLLKKRKLAVVFRNGQFNKLDSQIITLEDNYDASLLIKDIPDATPNVIIIFNRQLFEAFFSFIEHYQKDINDKIQIINDMALFDNVGNLIQLCQKDARKIKKLAKIVKSEYFNSMDKTKIKESITAYGLKIDLNSENRIKLEDSDIWDILRILDDDCVKSDITGSKYLAHAKMKV